MHYQQGSLQFHTDLTTVLFKTKVYQFSLLDVSETSVLLLPGENTWSDPKHGTKSNTLEVWYKYFSTGKPEHFFALMQIFH